MKKTLLITVALALVSLRALAQNVNIPDANFKAYLVGNTSINTNSDSEIQVSEAAAYTGQISINQYSTITDLTGIEAFVNLTSIQCLAPNLVTVNISQNTALTFVNIRNNNLGSIDVSQNTALTSLYLLDINLTSIDVSANTSLTTLILSNNSLSNIDISQNPNLQYFYCDNNDLSSLDVSQNTNLVDLKCTDNNLSLLNMKNLSTGTLTSFDATTNPNLTCIEVDDVADAEANWTNVDATASFSLSCCTVNIPDANFKAYLVGNTSINTNSDSEIQCSEATAFTGQISINQYSTITDLTGIEAFVNLTSIQCLAPNLVTVNISQNTALTFVNIRNSNLGSIDVSQNTALTSLYLLDVNLTSIDVSANTSLTTLILSNNSLSNIDISQNPNLQYFYCDNNDLSSLDVSQNTNLVDLKCTDNNLSLLNMKNLSTGTLTSFDATTNPNLTCIEVDDVADAEANWTNVDATASFSLTCNTLVESISVQGQAGATAITTDDGTLQMEATVLPANANDASYTWSVANGTGEATIDANGLLTAVSNGTVTVTATANDGSGVSGDMEITISNQIVLVNSITVQGQGGATTITNNGGTLQMEATVLPTNANDATYTWSVANGTGEATIDANGLLTAVSDGTVTVTATANDGSGVTGDAVITISNQIVLVNSITVQGQGGATTITTNGGTLQMEATVLPANAIDTTYTWSVANSTGETTINANGLLTAVSNGTVTVTATANDGSGVSGDIEITISNQIVLVNSITVKGQGGATSITTKGGTLQMEATVLPSNADDTTYTWSVTNGTGEATIDSRGLLTAVSNGTVTVTATANDGSGVSGDVEITISNQIVLSVNDQYNISDLSIYPNPVSSVLNIDFDKTIEAITIVDAIGKPIKTISSPKEFFDVSDLTIGIYFLQIKTDKGLMSKKFIKD